MMKKNSGSGSKAKRLAKNEQTNAPSRVRGTREKKSAVQVTRRPATPVESDDAPTTIEEVPSVQYATTEIGETTTPNVNVNHAAAAAGENRMAQLTRRKISRNGKNVLYGAAGYGPAGVRFPRSMFAGEPPETITIEANFVEPKVKANAPKDPARAAELEARRQERLQKAQERAQKAQERAQKASERLAKLQSRAKGTQPTPQEQAATVDAAEAETVEV
jgi:hypothetical protein